MLLKLGNLSFCQSQGHIQDEAATDQSTHAQQNTVLLQNVYLVNYLTGFIIFPGEVSHSEQLACIGSNS